MIVYTIMDRIPIISNNAFLNPYSRLEVLHGTINHRLLHFFCAQSCLDTNRPYLSDGEMKCSNSQRNHFLSKDGKSWLSNALKIAEFAWIK